MIGTILMCFAFVFFCFAAWGVERYGRVNLVALGLALWVLGVLLGRVPFP